MEYESYIHTVDNIIHQIGMINELMAIDGVEHKENIQSIRELINRSKKLKEDFVKYRKNDKIKKETINVNEVVEEVVADNEKYATIKNVRVERQLKKCRAYTDRRLLKECIDVLVNNAIKYSVERDGGDMPRVVIITKQTQEYSEVYVYDWGVGMAKEEMSKIGTPFYRAKRIDVYGSGMGWAILKKNMQKLGIKGKTLSGVGEGTAVMLRIPHVMG